MRVDALAVAVLALAVVPLISGCGLVRSKEISAATSSSQLAKFQDRDLCNPQVEGTPAVLAERVRRNLGDCTVEHAQCVRAGFASGTDGYLRCRSALGRERAARSAAEASAWAQIGAMGQQMTQPPPLPPPPPRPTVCTNYGMQMVCQ